MKILPAAMKSNLANDQRNYLVYADITLLSGVVLNLTNAEIWADGFSYEEAVSEDESFTALGSAIVGSAKVVINNIYEDYSPYDFLNASAVLYLGMMLDENGTTRLEKFKIGTYRVEQANYNGAIITLQLLDNMEKFDKPYNASAVNKLVYPATLGEIVRDACTKCGVVLSSLYQSFPHSSYTVSVEPPSESTTYRDVLSWAAAIAGCFAKCNPDGQLEIKWFDQAALGRTRTKYTEAIDGGIFDPWNNDTTREGGSFNPWNEETAYDGGTFDDFVDELGVHYINGVYTQSIAMDDTVITGINIKVKETDSSQTSGIVEYNRGTTGYVISIENNGFITKTNANEIIEWLGNQLIGLQFRKMSISVLSDPSVEAGDIAVVADRNNLYISLVTRVNFTADGNQTIVSGGSTPLRNSAIRYSEQTKSYVEARKLLQIEKSDREQAIQDLDSRLAARSGLWTTIESTSSGNIYYLHDRPNRADSTVVWKLTSQALGVSTNGGTSWNAGITVDGQVIATILNADGVVADWIRGGTITLGGSTVNNGSNGSLKINNSGGTEIGRWDRNGMVIKNSSGSEIGRWDVNGLKISKNGTEKFKVDANGNTTVQSLTAYGSLICYETMT